MKKLNSEPTIKLPMTIPKSAEKSDLKENNSKATNVETNTEDFSPPMKKLKRERYASDMTNVTRSGKNLLNKLSDNIVKPNLYVTPFLEEDFEKDFSFENHRFDNFDNYDHHSFMMSPSKVRF